MKTLNDLKAQIIRKVNNNLRELNVDVSFYVEELIPEARVSRSHTLYGITGMHPVDFDQEYSIPAGSLFLGKCRISRSLLYQCDIRGDELKRKGAPFSAAENGVFLQEDEGIFIRDSCLIHTLIHSCSHDPDSPEAYCIEESCSAPYANIHGSPTKGTFLGPFATADLTTLSHCVIGDFSYVQTGRLDNVRVEPGTLWIRGRDAFDFFYRYRPEDLHPYIHREPGKAPGGHFMDFIEARKGDFQQTFDRPASDPPIPLLPGTHIDPYAVVKSPTTVGENVFISQRAYLESAHLGPGSNAQENCILIDARLEGNNVCAHGAKLIRTFLEKDVFTGFNAFLRGPSQGLLTIGEGCIVMPHTIIDAAGNLAIPPRHLVWGLIREAKDLKTQTCSLDSFSRITERFTLGDLVFEGNGAQFVTSFQDRIHHILESNGAFCDAKGNRGHAQNNSTISYNVIRPYPEGPMRGIYPKVKFMNYERREGT